MKFNHYIAVSVLSHILLIGFLALAYPTPKTMMPIFDVDIVGPLEIPAQPSKKTMKPRIRKRRPRRIYRRPKPPDSELLPETIHGEETRLTPQTQNDLDKSEDSNSSEDHNSITEKKRPLLSGSEERAFLPFGKDGLSLAPRSFLFDKETIDRFARKSSPEKKNLTFDVSEFKYRGYMKMLKQKIEGIWEYPKDVARQGISGDLYIRFSIKKDGTLGDIELIRTSGYRALDEAAMKALKDAEPFWPLPDDWKKDDLEIKGHFIYMLGGTYIL